MHPSFWAWHDKVCEILKFRGYSIKPSTTETFYYFSINILPESAADKMEKELSLY